MAEVSFFETPCGILRLTASDGSTVPFQIQQDIWEREITAFDEFQQEYIRLDTAQQYTVRIDAFSLKRHAEYVFRIDGAYPFSYGDSDECALANLCSTGSVTLSLGAADLNDAEKCRQAVPVMRGGVRIGLREPEQYDISKFSGYALFPLADQTGFRLTVLDDTVREIPFRLAWIPHTAEGADQAAYAAVTELTIM